MVQKKYRALRVVAFLLQVLAWVSLIIAILGAIGVVGAGFTNLDLVSIPTLEQLIGNNLAFVRILTGIVSAIVVFLIGLLYFLMLLAAAEFIHVQVDIEYNTRQNGEYLRQLTQVQQVVSAPAVQTVAPAPVVRTYPAEPTVTTQSTPETKP